MSKSKGNVVNPLTLTDKYGTDALRMALVVGNTPGTDVALQEDKVKAYKNFANKLWNIARFILSSTEGVSIIPDFKDYTEKDAALREERHNLIVEITKELDEYKFYIVSEKIYHYIWHNFADIILEESKEILLHGSDTEKQSRQQFLLHSLSKILICLHPFMPFVTEEIWSTIPKETKDDKNLLIIEKWPV